MEKLSTIFVAGDFFDAPRRQCRYCLGVVELKAAYNPDDDAMLTNPATLTAVERHRNDCLLRGRNGKTHEVQL